jgi:hypothetical protein
MLRGGGLEARAAESVRFERARSEARTSCDGLPKGQRFEKIAGKADTDCRGDRKAGPPKLVG